MAGRCLAAAVVALVAGVPWLAPTASVAIAVSAAAPVDIDLTQDELGLWVTYADGTVEARGSGTPHHGNTPALDLGESAIALAPTAAAGYWIFTDRGRVFAFGDAPHHGDVGHLTLAAPVIAAAPTSTGDGYYLLGQDGGIFAFGDAVFRGSLPGLSVVPNAPVVSMSATADGYLLIAEDGGTFAFGDAGFHGSLPGLGLNPASPIVDLVPGSAGYLMLGADGGIFNFGVSNYLGALVGFTGSPSVAVAVTDDLGGYVILTADGTAWPFGTARSAGVVRFTGVGDAVVAHPVPDRSAVRAVHTGTAGLFRVWALDAGGGVEDLLANTGGVSDGTYWLNAPATAQFQIEAEGPWTLEIAPLHYARKWSWGLGPLSGSGSDVVMIVASGPRTLTADGTGAAQVWHHRGEFLLTRSLLINETAAFAGATDTIPGTPTHTYLELLAHDTISWTMWVP